MFIEIRREVTEDERPPRTLQALAITNIEPKECSRIVKKLSKELPLSQEFQHLKRVRRVPVVSTTTTTATATTDNETDNNDDNNNNTGNDDHGENPNDSSLKKKPRLMKPQKQQHKQKQQNKQQQFQLQILIGKKKDEDDDNATSAAATTTMKKLVEDILGNGGDAGNNHNTFSFITVTVPGRHAESQQEHEEFTALWPMNFYPLKTEEYKEQSSAITDTKELQFMKQMIQMAIDTKTVIIVDPIAQTIQSQSNVEETKQQRQEQQQQSSQNDRNSITTTTTANNNNTSSSTADNSIVVGNDNNIVPRNNNNPLATPILFALQGISRKERYAACHLSGKDFAKGQYLCTGYDLYTYYEPTIFEAMSCVHSRLRRLIYFERQEQHEQQQQQPQSSQSQSQLQQQQQQQQQKQYRAVWTRGCSRHFVHCLPGTNHKFRAFEYRPEN